MVKRQEWSLRGGEIIYREEHVDGRYGAPGQRRQKKEKLTDETHRKANAANRTKRCRMRLLEYFDGGDLFVTLTYAVENRPADMGAAQRDFTCFIKKVGRRYKKRGYTLYWMRNIEKGTRGAWHTHLVIKQTAGRDAASIIQGAWTKGGVYVNIISRSNTLFDESFEKLANYITKDEYTQEKKKDGTYAKPRVAESSHSESRNMPLPEPDVTRLIHWPKVQKPKKGYYIASSYEGTNPVTGCSYRRYTMVRLGVMQN